ncbi:MAG TPA: phosphatidylserine decarboxylase family protein [Bacteroidales bacterium]|nr:phosphatidylserine decarboxylase family protein [Bacteroidales bacterium]HRW94756.1 phosphatidylserine decarboxylase family protein [Bacteroidales bacterium]
MRIHKEGRTTILIVIVIIAVILAVILGFSLYNFWVLALFGAASVVVLLQTLMFFRIPQRDILIREEGIVSPADGRIVMIEEVEVNEYLKEKRLQVSIFMNMFNVHVNWYPCAGDIVYYKYHPGDKMVAWHPKSSEKNEHATVFLEHGKNIIGVKQIAGLIARRVICKARTGKQVLQCSELGIIKFGSRVDLLLPLDAKILVRKGQRVWGCETLIADLKE